MQEISIRFLARRTGIAASALRYYETRGLLKPQRNRAGQRRYPRSDIRRVSIVIIAQKCGFRLRDIKKLLAPLSQNRSPTAAEWALVSQAMRAELNRKIQQTTNLGDQLESCIGCGCLSMKACHLFNAQDYLAKQGAGPMRFALQAAPFPASDSD
jgi:MerR family redox-sensitive transcriptional activator SoxR